MRPRSGRSLTIPRVLTAAAIGLVSACPDDNGSGPDDCPMYASMDQCEAGDGCAWDPQDLECVVDCAAIGSRATCNDQERCFWEGDVCHFGVL